MKTKYIFNSVPVYLLVFCIQAPFSIYEIYSAFYDKFGIVPAILLFFLICAVIFTILRVILRNIELAGLLTLVALLVLFPKAAMAVPVYLIVAIAGCGSIAVRIWKRKDGSFRTAAQVPVNFTPTANVVAIAIAVALGARTAYFDYKIADQVHAITEAADASGNMATSARAPRTLPHIVHIVLDGYSRADVLRNTYGFDNTPFLDALKQRGFRIAEKAVTPFNQTLAVMSAIFSLGSVVDSIPDFITTNDSSTLRKFLARSQQHGIVPDILNRLGYELQSTPSTYLPLQWNRIVGADGYASVVNHFRVPETYIFGYDLLSSSPVLAPLAEPLLSDQFGIVSVNFRNLKDVPKRRFHSLGNRPQFIYQHILAPHPPFNITNDGRPRSLNGFPEALDDGSHLIKGNKNMHVRYRDGYITKLQYINAAILEQIDGLNETLDGPLIIILHGDHGGGLHFDQDKKERTCLNERFSPLFAVFATDDAILREFNDSSRLVNVYRAIFRAMLDVDLPDLPSRSMFVSWDLDKATNVSASELAATCAAPRGTWTADRAPSSPNSPDGRSIGR
jgi:hypothetical protein